MEPARRLSGWTATLLVVASMVGTGVFTTSGFLVRDIGSLGAVLVAWAVGGAVALFGALAYAELVSAMPHNGGEYQLLSRLYHPSVGFVSGFSSLVVGFSAPTAASAIAFGEYLGIALDMPRFPATAAAVGLVIVTSAVHAADVRVGTGFQNAFTAFKIALVAVFVVIGLAAANLGALSTGDDRPFGAALASPAFAIGLVYVSFAYSGWNAAAYVAGEVERPSRNLPIALLAGTGLVTLLYVGVNAVLLTAAPAAELAGAEERVAAVATTRLFGDLAGRGLAAMIALGLVSTVGALVMTGPRVYEAMGRDHPAIALLARRRAGGGPVISVGLQAVLALVMVLTASFDDLLAYIGFTLSLFAGLTVAGVFVLRRRGTPSPYRTLGHPFTTVAFIAVSLLMVGHSIVGRPYVALTGLATIAAGLVAWRLLARRA